MKTFKEWYKQKFIFKIHTFSNSGATDYGISIIISDYNELSESTFRPLKFDKLLFSKKGKDLSKDEFVEFENILKLEYKSYLDEFENSIKDKEALDNFIEINKHKLISIIPFSYTEHYDVLHLNCTDEDILKQSGKKEVKNLTDYYNLSEQEKSRLIYMVFNNVRTFEAC